MTEPENATQQRNLSSEQVEAFYHDDFVNDQTRHFIEMAPNPAGSGLVVDVGGAAASSRAGSSNSRRARCA